MLKMSQNFLKSLFVDPWRRLFLRVTDKKFEFFQDESALIKEVEFIVLDF